MDGSSPSHAGHNDVSVHQPLWCHFDRVSVSGPRNKEGSSLGAVQGLGSRKPCPACAILEITAKGSGG